MDIDTWPKMANYPQTEMGWNQYMDDWITRRRQAVLMSRIPIAAIVERQAAMALGQKMGWKDYESCCEEEEE